MTMVWQDNILKNFDKACNSYNSEATIQDLIAKQLAKECFNHQIPPGLWLDLGTGTGLLADALEKLNKDQSVIRVDGSLMMLKHHSRDHSVRLWDLNLGLPNISEPPVLIASSFALHWLNNPQARLQEWFSVLKPGGLLALALPVHGSFPEWHEAAALSNVQCTAMDFPSQQAIINTFPVECIRYQKTEKITQSANGVTPLLKPFIKIGAQATHHKPLKISEWRRLQKAWRVSEKTSKNQLTWLIQLVLAQK